MDVESLPERGLALTAELTHEGLADFVVEYFLRRPTWLTRAHHAMSLASLAAAIAAGWGELARSFQQCGAAIVALVLVILPLHEALHALAYRLSGARDVRWKVAPRMLAVYVVAHRFVASARTFVFVALAPFVVLNAVLVAGAIAEPRYAVFFLALLVLHLHGASGDWALLNFVWLQRKRGFWTWDDAESGRSYFYGTAE